MWEYLENLGAKDRPKGPFRRQMVIVTMALANQSPFSQKQNLTELKLQSSSGEENLIHERGGSPVKPPREVAGAYADL